MSKSEVLQAGSATQSGHCPPPDAAKSAPRIWRWRAPLDLLALVSSAKSFRDNPVLGSPAFNRAGLHIRRKLIADRIGKIRRRQLSGMISDEDRLSFERDGFLVKENFLDPATFEALRGEIVNLRAAAREAVIGDALTRLIPLDAVTLHGLPTTKSVLEGKAYRSLLDYIGSFRRRPHLYIQTVFSRVREAEPDVQSYFHFDTFHPTVKSWLFLDDVAEDATPFTYVPGSHRITKRRLAWERRVSVTAWNAGDRLTAEGSFRISESEIARLGYGEPRRLPVAANTLVIADTSGIHRRGTAKGTSRRLSIWAYSRSNPFLPFVGGDIVALPLIRGYALRFYWAITDRIKDIRRVRRDWRWVGQRSPLSPP
jgi:hypothetical protein